MLMPRAVLRRHRRVRWILTQALLVLISVFCYFQVRGLTHADPLVAIRHAHQVMEFEQWLGLRFELAVQARVIAHDSAERVGARSGVVDRGSSRCWCRVAGSAVSPATGGVEGATERTMGKNVIRLNLSTI